MRPRSHAHGRRPPEVALTLLPLHLLDDGRPPLDGHVVEQLALAHVARVAHSFRPVDARAQAGGGGTFKNEAKTAARKRRDKNVNFLSDFFFSRAFLVFISCYLS